MCASGVDMVVLMPMRILLLVVALMLLAACAGSPPKAPYPVFMQVNELEDVFLASLPGARAKQLAGDSQTRRTSNRIDLPQDWRGTSGGVPGRSMEIYVLAGTLMLADIELRPGGYAFLPAGSLGFNMATEDGARILYFVNDVDPESVIRAPIIINADLLDWQPTATPGMLLKELRKDPGNGAMTWLLYIETGAAPPWESSTAAREGYLVAGDYQHSECVGQEVLTGQYSAGGYFQRPAGVINGGPLSGTPNGALWFLREPSGGTHELRDGCAAL
jgi:hypothetical protein